MTQTDAATPETDSSELGAGREESSAVAVTRRQFTQAEVPPFAALRGEDSLYVDYQSGEREYYDLASDPAALDNIVDELSPEQAEALAAQLSALIECSGAACREAEGAALPSS